MQTAEILSQVRRIEIITGRLVAETFAGEYQSVFKGHGMEFAEVREYTPGDDVRSIDWNVTARLGRPFIKRYVEERELTLLIACDISGSQRFGTRGRFKSEVAAELSALFAFAALKNSDKAGLLLFSDRSERYIPPKKGKTHALRIIRDLLAHKPQSSGTDLGRCLDTVNRVLKRRAIVVLISDFLCDKYDQALKLAAKKHDLIPVMLYDKAETSLPSLPVLLQTADPETGRLAALDLSSSAVTGELARAHAKCDAHAEKLFSLLGLDYIKIGTHESASDKVVEFFRKRERKLHS